MKNAFLIHGTNGNPQENWFPWLQHLLEARGYTVKAPQFPLGEAQTPTNWQNLFDQYRPDFNHETLLVGHSYGAGFLLRALEKNRMPVKAAVLVAPPCGVPPIKYWDLDEPLFRDGFDWATIKAAAEHHIVFHSEDDPFISLGNGQQVAEQLGVELHKEAKAGHFNAASGYTEFPQLWEALEPII